MFKFNGKLALLSTEGTGNSDTLAGNRKSDVAFFGHTVTVDGTRQRYFKKLEVGKRCYCMKNPELPTRSLENHPIPDDSESPRGIWH
jgi:hypothetical protein